MKQLIIFPLIILGSRLEVVRFRGGYLFYRLFIYTLPLFKKDNLIHPNGDWLFFILKRTYKCACKSFCFFIRTIIQRTVKQCKTQDRQGDASTADGSVLGVHAQGGAEHNAAYRSSFSVLLYARAHFIGNQHQLWAV